MIVSRSQSAELAVVIPVKADFDGLAISLAALAPLATRLECVVVDGTDADGQQVAHWSGERRPDAPHWDVLVTGAQAGVYAAMNAGVAKATAPWVLFCGAGDLLAAETVTAALDRLGEPDVLHAYTVDMGSEREGGVPAVHRPKWGRALTWRNTLHHQGLIIPKDWLVATPFAKQFRVLSDYHWLLQQRERNVDVRLHREVLTTCAPGGLSRQFRARLYREEWQVKRDVWGWSWRLGGQVIWLPLKWTFKQLARLAT